MRISDWSSDVCSSDLFVAGNLLGRKDHAIARIELDRVRALGHARQSGARLALPAGRDDHHLLARQAHRLVEIDDLGKVAQITGLARDAQDPVERRSEERRVGTEGLSTCRYRWVPVHAHTNDPCRTT